MKNEQDGEKKNLQLFCSCLFLLARLVDFLIHVVDLLHKSGTGQRKDTVVVQNADIGGGSSRDGGSRGGVGQRA